ncbi:MAG: GNAT family protein [Paracoccaceae bacterium]|jgi:RimJ/RimL family protein N-acetyltransferase|nr:GNAT family protein [Paracoccaceae bacterium]
MSGRPTGPAVADWSKPPRPADIHLPGRFCRIEPLGLSHAPALFEAIKGQDWVFDYMYEEPFQSLADYQAWVEMVSARPDPYFVALCRPDGTPFGTASFMRITQAHGVIEVGNINITPNAQRSTAVTEAMFLMMGWAFDSGYRRYEWKCNALNAPSRRAAQRFGFSFEGIFRRHMIVKDRNRDTAWFAMVEDEWPDLRHAYQTWLSPENFSADGTQRQRLGALTAPYLVSTDPTL